MKKLILLGDSIRMGYGKAVPELLRDEFVTWQPEENCRFSKYTLRYASFEWAPQIRGSDVIHWNNGLWDVCDLGYGVFTPLEEYVQNMTRLAELLLQMGKRVIFATTTPVKEDHRYHTNALTEQYNAQIVPVLRNMGVQINDLYSFVYPHWKEWICEDLIHLNDAGIAACAAQIEKVIRSAE